MIEGAGPAEGPTLKSRTRRQVCLVLCWRGSHPGLHGKRWQLEEGGRGRGREWMLSGVWLVSARVGEWQRDGSQREMETKRKRKDRGTERKATSREPERDGRQSRGRGDSHGVGAQNTSSKKGHLS